MATVTTATLKELARTVNDVYKSAFKRAEVVVTPLYRRNPTAEAKFVHGFLANVPAFRDWDGPRIRKNVKLEDIPGKTQKKELTISVDVDDLASSTFSRYLDEVIPGMGEEAKHLPQDLIADYIKNGNGTEAKYQNYDGNPTFSSSRTINGTTYSNYATSTSLTNTNLEEKIEEMMAFVNPEGKKMGIKPTHLVVGPSLAFKARKLLENQYDDAGASNIHYNSLKLIVVPEIDTDDWLLVDAAKFAPFTYYVFEDPSDVVVKNAPTDDNVFDEDIVLMGAKGKVAVYPTVWQYFFRCTE